MPGSLAALFILIALVPGFVLLKLTERRRRADHKPSPIDEVLLLVIACIVSTGPIALSSAWIADGTVVTLLATEPSEIDTALLRRLLLLISAIFSGSILLAFIEAWTLQAIRPVRASESSWHAAFTISDSAQLDVTLKDGRVIQGFLHAYDGVSHGQGRDIVLMPSGDTRLQVAHSDGQVEPLNCDAWVVSETNVDSIAVHAVTAAPTSLRWWSTNGRWTTHRLRARSASIRSQARALFGR